MAITSLVIINTSKPCEIDVICYFNRLNIHITFIYLFCVNLSAFNSLFHVDMMSNRMKPVVQNKQRERERCFTYKEISNESFTQGMDWLSSFTSSIKAKFLGSSKLYVTCIPFRMKQCEFLGRFLFFFFLSTKLDLNIEFILIV